MNSPVGDRRESGVDEPSLSDRADLPVETVTVVLPTKNEAEGICSVIDSVKRYADEILVVDGQSTDETVTLARNAGARVILDGGRGKGEATRVAIQEARGDILVFMDADGSHEPSDIPRLIYPIQQGKADLVIGSRITGGSEELHGDLNNFMRFVGGTIISLSINYRWNVRITDSLNGFRAIRKEVARALQLTANDFDIEQQMITRCLRKGYRVAEVPSHEYVRKWGRSKLPTYRKGYLFIRRLILDLIGL